MLDPAWDQGEYYGGPGLARGMSVARSLGMITYQNESAYCISIFMVVAPAAKQSLPGTSLLFRAADLAYLGARLVTEI
jgi:homoserine acetyltransferase